jgi:hypothetical protein
MADLLKRLIKQNVAVDYIGKLLAAFGDEELEAVLDVSESKPAVEPSVRPQPLVEPPDPSRVRYPGSDGAAAPE